MAQLGRSILLLDLGVCLYAVVASIYGARTRQSDWVDSGRRAVYCLAGLSVIAFTILEIAFIRNDFSFKVVADTSSTTIPTFYKLTAPWSSQQGSLLLWVTLSSLWSSLVLFITRKRLREIAPYATAVLMGMAGFFAALAAFAANPFATFTPALTPGNGAGLDPLLMHPSMMFHPPMLYSGYTLMAIPFAFAIGALIAGKLGSEWIRDTRRFALAAWLFLGVGIVLGARWSYTELGWGGYWGWDAVENAALMPWLMITAFIHSAQIQEKRGMLKVWNVSLVLLAGTLAIFGTFLVRSGVLDSIHAFGASTLGVPFVILLAIMAAGSIGLVLYRREGLRTEHRIDSLLSREAMFLLQNLVLVAMVFVIFWITLFPLISDAITGTKVSVGPPAFTPFIVPLALILVLALCFAGEGVVRMIRAREHLTEAQTEIRKTAALWRMMFDQSPLPQMFFDASALHDLIDGSSLHAPRGDSLQTRAPSLKNVLDRIKLNGANAAAERLFGVADFDDGLTGRHFDADFVNGLSRSLNAGGPDGMLTPFETRVRTADGAVRDVRVHIHTIPDRNRPWSNGIATFVDVTEARRAAEAQAAALEAAEAANRAKSDFLATMSHEIRTPLNGVLGMAQAMAAEALPETQRERLAVVRRSGETLLTILNDILDLSKIEAGKLELEEVDFDIAEVASATVAGFGAVATGKGVALDLRVADAAAGVYRSDPTRVRQILSNLISNALKFTEQGGVQVVVDRVGEVVEMRVRDTGIGIPPDRLDRLFKKFAQADASTTRKYGGTGLGLSICRELTEIIGGDIRAESTVGEGTTFIVRLLIARVGDALALEAEEAAPRDWDAGALRILAAEDNSVNQLVLKTLLSQVGIDPMVVSDGAEAVEAWREHDWDLILMDVQMPVMDGPTATRAIRELERAKGRARTPIIALTANAMAHQIAEYRAAGMDGFVSKPIDIEKLFAAIEAGLDEAGDATDAEAVA